jgi:hypothetical protein
MRFTGSLFFVFCCFLASAHDTTFRAAGNPIIRHKFTADPAAMVHNGKVYVYTGHDQAPPRHTGYQMNEWLVFSSPDMVNWTEHAVPLRVKDFAWAKADAWASQVIERNGKFYWYVAVEHGQAWLFWGNTACYYAKLKNNMIELDGEIKTISLPKFTEAPYMVR